MSINKNDIGISVSDVRFSYNGSSILENITFTVKTGEYLGIIGPNGGGKTTLLKIILGLITPTAGVVKIFGQDVREFKEKYLIGYVPQRVSHIGLFPATVEEIVASGRTPRIGLFKSLHSDDRKAITAAMEVADVKTIRNKLIGSLSGGERQRVFIARALAGNPKILILDEPAVGVDVATQQSFYAFLQNLNKELGITILFVSHDIDVVADEVQCVLCLNRGLVCHGSPKQSFTAQNLEKLYGRHIKVIHHGHHHD